jgi:nitronate monooxygenase
MRYPIIQAPMAGGPSCPNLVSAINEAGGMGFLAAGYKTTNEMANEVSEVKQLTRKPFGVNVFVPQKIEVDKQALSSYVQSLLPEAERLGVTSGEPVWDDDQYNEKIEYLLANPVPVVSFTFGCPPKELISRMQRGGSFVIITVTTPEGKQKLPSKEDLMQYVYKVLRLGDIEVRLMTMIYQVRILDFFSLLSIIRSKIDLPLIAAGGITRGRDMAAVLMSGAAAAQIGTAFLRCPESGTNPSQKSAMANSHFQYTVITRAFSGKRARGIINRFMLEHPDAPAAYPQINNITKPIRRAAFARGDTDVMNMWAGQGFHLARELPAANIVKLFIQECLQAFDDVKMKIKEFDI